MRIGRFEIHWWGRWANLGKFFRRGPLHIGIGRLFICWGFPPEEDVEDCDDCARCGREYFVFEDMPTSQLGLCWECVVATRRKELRVVRGGK